MRLNCWKLAGTIIDWKKGKKLRVTCPRWREITHLDLFSLIGRNLIIERCFISNVAQLEPKQITSESNMPTKTSCQIESGGELNLKFKSHPRHHYGKTHGGFTKGDSVSEFSFSEEFVYSQRVTSIVYGSWFSARAAHRIFSSEIEHQRRGKYSQWIFPESESAFLNCYCYLYYPVNQ